jgi:integrase
MATFVKLQGKTGTSYRAVIRKKGLKPITKTFKKKGDAQKWATRIEGDAGLAAALGDGRMRGKTFGDMMNAHMKDYQGKSKSVMTQLNYWADKLGKVSLVKIDRDLIMDELEILANEPAKRGGGTRDKDIVVTDRKRTPATINRYLAAISSVYKTGIAKRIVKENPCHGIPRGKENNHFGRALSEDERNRLLKTCKASSWDRLYLLVAMALSTGARLGELQSLSWNDLDMKTAVAKLDDTKNGSPRHLPVIPVVMDQLKALPRPIDGTTLIFCGENKVLKNKTVVRADTHKPFEFRKLWEQARDDADIELYQDKVTGKMLPFRFHWLRHSAASYLTEAGVPLVTVADILGHKTMAMVQRYSHVAVKHKAEVVNDTFSDMLS